MNAELRIQMLAFIQSQPSIVERLLRHVETPSFVDLLVRIIQLDEQISGAGVLEESPLIILIRERADVFLHYSVAFVGKPHGSLDRTVITYPHKRRPYRGNRADQGHHINGNTIPWSRAYRRSTERPGIEPLCARTGSSRQCVKIGRVYADRLWSRKQCCNDD